MRPCGSCNSRGLGVQAHQGGPGAREVGLRGDVAVPGGDGPGSSRCPLPLQVARWMLSWAKATFSWAWDTLCKPLLEPCGFSAGDGACPSRVPLPQALCSDVLGLTDPYDDPVSQAFQSPLTDEETESSFQTYEHCL